MQLFQKYFSFSLLLLFGFQLWGQIKDTGIPFIVNHTRNTYQASAQNWSITQSSKGFMYFGNNNGILEYDGKNWKTYPVSNNLIVRSVYGVNDTIYAGAFEEIGFLAHTPDSGMQYHSLTHLIPKENLDFDEVWDIYSRGKEIIFRSSNYIFIYNGKSIQVIDPFSTFRPMHHVGDQFFVTDDEKGLMRLEGDTLIAVSEHPVVFRNEIRSMIAIEYNQYLLGTSNEGVFLWKEGTIQPWRAPVNDFLRQDMLYSATKLSDGSLAWGSLSNGVYITNQKGEIMQHLDRYKGLQNNTVLSLFEDKGKNLWIGLDNGIDFIEVNSPLSHLNFNYNIETPYTSIIHNGIFYVGTNQGLYALDKGKVKNTGKDIDRFRLIKGTEGQVWNLSLIDGTLFCGHNFGCFEIDGYNARKISDLRGFWDFIPAPFPDQKNTKIIAGTYSGLVTLEKINNRWIFADTIKGFNESSRTIFIDKKNTIWISHGYRGIYKLKVNASLDSVNSFKLFRQTHGLPESLPYNIQKINEQMFVTTPAGIFRFNYDEHTFYKPGEINQIFEGKEFIDLIRQDEKGNFWYFTHDYMGVMRLLEDGTYRDISAPFSGLTENLLPAFQNIFIDEDDNVWIGSWNGLVHYNSDLIKDFGHMEDVFVREVNFYGNQDSTSVYDLDKAFRKQGPKTKEIPFKRNSVTFRFTLPSYEDPRKIFFSHRLVGFNQQWSDWDDVNFKEFTNLREGDYIFEVRAMNPFGNISPVKSINFEVAPPFFRSKTAYGIYAFLLFITIVANIYFVRRRILRIRQREKLKHEKKLAEKEQDFKEKTALSEQEIIHLRNESLKNEMNHKNRELANATLHLIQKNKTLTSLRDDLNKLQKNNTTDSSQSFLLNNLIKKINRDLRNEKNWELFNNYFDDVHQDFINRLKSDFDNLSPKELRLCAYLRMNISSKEIAPLMNISVRGVEISRYRLRKKLDLPHDTNLTDFIMSY